MIAMSPAQKRTPLKSPSRNRFNRGDVLGQKKSQQTILKYFLPRTKNEIIENKPAARKQLFVGTTQLLKRTHQMETIVISDDERSEQGRVVENYLPKRKKVSLSRKSLSLKTSARSNIVKEETAINNDVTGERIVDNENDLDKMLKSPLKSRKRKTLDFVETEFKDDRELVENSPPDCVPSRHNESLNGSGSEKKFKLSPALESSDDYLREMKPANSPLTLSNFKANDLVESKDQLKKLHSGEKSEFQPVKWIITDVRTVDKDIATLDQIDWTDPIDLVDPHEKSNCHQSTPKTHENRTNNSPIPVLRDHELSLSVSKKTPISNNCAKTTDVSQFASSCVVKEPRNSQNNSDAIQDSSAKRRTDLSQYWDKYKEQPSKTSNCANDISTSTSPVKISCTPTKMSQSLLRTPTKTLLQNLPCSTVVKVLPSTSDLPQKQSPSKRSPNKMKSPAKYDNDATSGNLLIEHAISECSRYAQLAIKLNATNKKVADNFLDLGHSEKILLHHLLMRKWSWIRDTEMKYDKFAPNKIGSLNVLCSKGFVENANDQVELEVLLDKLKLPELSELCKSHKLPSNGTKKDLMNQLLKFSNCQGNLGFTMRNVKTVMKEKALQMVGRCVRLTEQSRAALQEIFEASMSPIYLEGQYYSFQERLRGMESLMNDVKFNGKKLIPFALTDAQLFINTVQFDQYIYSAILKFKMLSAKEKKNTAEGIELTKDARSSLLVYLHCDATREYLDKLPSHAWRFTAGSNYTSAVDIGLEFFKRDKQYDSAIVSLDMLLLQEVYRKHLRGHWYAEKLLIMDRYQKRPASEMYPVLMKGLQEELTPIGRLELSKRAEMILNKKKGLNADEKEAVRRLIKLPSLRHTVKEIRGTEAPNVSSGTRQTYVEVSKTGDRVYSNVEQTAMNSYKAEYPEGVHDEGSFIKNIILAVFWPIIYTPKAHMFISKYQFAPLDWGTHAFYSNRQNEIESFIARLKDGGIDKVMGQIVDVITVHLHHHSVVDWYYICHDMLPTIRNILNCLTLDKFFLLADYLLRSFRERRSGWPDLTLWNTVTGTFKFVEVKSPNDELSLKQIVWLEKLTEFEIHVEECRVNPTNKGKRRKQPTSEVMSEASQEV